jgi:acetyl-CoA C-acetyltransferase
MAGENVILLSGTRTAIGTFGGSLKEISPAKLGEIVIREALIRSGLESTDIGHVVMGQAIPSIPQDAYLARVAAIEAGIPVSVPALTLNRLCGSGLQALISAAQMIALGEADFVIAGGAESMSQSPHYVTDARFGKKMGDITMRDALNLTLSDPRGGYHMGMTAENIAERYAIGRLQQDETAVSSHERASRAILEGRFVQQIVPVEVRSGRETIAFQTDEHVRTDATIEQLSALRPVFKKNGTVTAGNASGINDGGAALVVGSQRAALEKGLKPLARILGWAHAGVDPSVMGLGPVQAVPIALRRAGLSLAQMDVIESNEAFAAQACAVASELGFDPEKTNINGSGISLGHPVGATGAIMVVKTLYELERQYRRYGLITMCIGGGQGIALILERLS